MGCHSTSIQAYWHFGSVLISCRKQKISFRFSASHILTLYGLTRILRAFFFFFPVTHLGKKLLPCSCVTTMGLKSFQALFLYGKLAFIFYSTVIWLSDWCWSLEVTLISLEFFQVHILQHEAVSQEILWKIQPCSILKKLPLSQFSGPAHMLVKN